MSSMWWRRKPQKWHRSNRVRGVTSSGFSTRNRNTGLPGQRTNNVWRPMKRTMTGGIPRTTGYNRYRANQMRWVSRTHYKGVSNRRYGAPFVLGRGGAPGRPIALGTGSRGRTQAVSRRALPHSAWFAKSMLGGSRSRRGYAVAGGAALVGAGVYAGHRYRQRRIRRNYKGQFAGSY